MKIYICVGSSCHLKGSYEVLNKLKDLIAKENLGDKIELLASFCLGHCCEGVTVKINETFMQYVSKENIEQKFYSEIVPQLG